MRNIETDILLVGGGIMSATLGVLLHQLDPTLNITMVEQLPEVALEMAALLFSAP
jgi:malate dehydrogenase (quinone)